MLIVGTLLISLTIGNLFTLQVGGIINENGLGITIIGFSFIVLGILVCITYGFAYSIIFKYY